MRLLLAVLIVTFCMGVLACGDAHKGTTARVGESAKARTRAANGFGLSINDADDSDDMSTTNTKGEKTDDQEVDFYGHAANPVDKRAVTTFAKRFMAAAAAEDGATACSLLLPSLAESLPSTYGKKGSGLPYLRGSTCAAVMSKLFTHFHRQFAAEAAGLEVTGVRVAGKTASASPGKIAFALLSFKGSHERRYMGVERFGKGWKLEALRDSEYP
jgi:hypothetical protein